MTGLKDALRSLVTVGLQRMREGELGPLPVVVGLIAIWAYFESQEGVYLSARNLSNLVLQISPIAAVAIGIVLVLLLGEIDLSVGSIAGLCSAVLGVLIVNHGWPWWGAILVMVGVGAAIGAFQGGGSRSSACPSFVVTLAGFLFWQGVQLRVLGSTGTVNVFEPHIATIAQSYLPDYWGWIIGVGAAGVYALRDWTTHARRPRAELPAEPRRHRWSCATVAVAAIAIASRRGAEQLQAACRRSG